MDSILTDNYLTNVANVVKIAIPLDSDEDETEEDYSMWFQEGNEYIPSTNLKTVEKIPSGAYKIICKRDEWRVMPVSINNDELYSFSNDITSKMLDEVQLFWDKKHIYEEHKLTHKRGVLLFGPAGSGKSSIISMLTEQIIKNDGLVFIATSASEFISLAECLNPIVRKIEKDRPVITIIEDVDQIITAMNGDSQLLDFLDGKTSINHHLVILTSNNTTDLSAALLRPSRIDMCVEIAGPSEEVRLLYFQKKGITDEELLKEYVDKTEGFSFAELKEVFIGTQILGKEIDNVIEQIENPFEYKDYLNKTIEMKGID